MCIFRFSFLSRVLLRPCGAAQTGATSRCIAFDDNGRVSDTCVVCGREAKEKVIWAKAY
ncbi:MAG: hypothetical protein ACO1OC_13855 [Tuberibacillus sp.]